MKSYKGNASSFLKYVTKQCFSGKPIIKLHESLTILKIAQLFIAEFLGTAVLLFVGCSGCNDGMYGDEQSVIHKGLNFGISVMAAIQVHEFYIFDVSQK